MLGIPQRIDLALTLLSLCRWIDVIAVNLLEHQMYIWLIENTRPWLRFLHLIIPQQRLQATISRFLTIGIQLFQTLAEVIDKPEVRASITGRINSLVAPLQEALRVRERPLFFGLGSSGHEENLRFDLARIDRLGFRSVSWLLVPERCRLYLVQIKYDHP